MLSVLVEGTLLAAPVRRTSARGSAFVTAQLRVHVDDGESVLCSVIAFQTQAAEALAVLGAGATVAVTGPGAISRWEKDGEPRVGLKVTATRVMAVQEAAPRGEHQARAAIRSARAGCPARAQPPSQAPGRSEAGGSVRGLGRRCAGVRAVRQRYGSLSSPQICLRSTYCDDIKKLSACLREAFQDRCVVYEIIRKPEDVQNRFRT